MTKKPAARVPVQVPALRPGAPGRPGPRAAAPAIPSQNIRPDDALLAAYQKLESFGLVWKSRQLVINAGMVGNGFELFTMTGRAALDVYVRVPKPKPDTEPPWRGRLQVYAVGGEVEVLVAEALVQFPFEEGRFLRLRDKYAPRWRVRFKLDSVPPDIALPFAAEFLAVAFGESNTLPPVYVPFSYPVMFQQQLVCPGACGLSSINILQDVTASIPNYVGLYDTDPSVPVFNDSTLRQRWLIQPGQHIHWQGLATMPYRQALWCVAMKTIVHDPGESATVCWGQLDRTAELEVTAGTP